MLKIHSSIQEFVSLIQYSVVQASICPVDKVQPIPSYYTVVLYYRPFYSGKIGEDTFTFGWHIYTGSPSHHSMGSLPTQQGDVYHLVVNTGNYTGMNCPIQNINIKNIK